MPQEHHVLLCCSCETFQAHIVKKVKKWDCKICGTKQSVKRNYGRGAGKDCRLQVQKLNQLRMTKDEVRKCDIPDSAAALVNNAQFSNSPSVKNGTSKWSTYIDANSDNDVDELETATATAGFDSINKELVTFSTVGKQSSKKRKRDTDFLREKNYPVKRFNRASSSNNQEKKGNWSECFTNSIHVEVDATISNNDKEIGNKASENDEDSIKTVAKATVSLDTGHMKEENKWSNHVENIGSFSQGKGISSHIQKKKESKWTYYMEMSNGTDDENEQGCNDMLQLHNQNNQVTVAEESKSNISVGHDAIYQEKNHLTSNSLSGCDSVVKDDLDEILRLDW